MTIRPFPELRALAEAEARAHHDDAVRAIKGAGHGTYGQALIDALPPRWVEVDAAVLRLCDLTRPASQDAVCRLVAKKLPCTMSGIHAFVEGSVEGVGLFPRAFLEEIADLYGADELAAIVHHLWPESKP